MSEAIPSPTTVIIGATTNPTRYAYIAAQRLRGAGKDFIPVGIKKGEVAGEEILDLRQRPEIPDVDTITLYIGPQNQEEWYDYILGLAPRRIIFNPGTENAELMEMARNKGIEVEAACTLVMLSVGTY